MVRNTTVSKIRIYFLEFTTLVNLDCFNFSVKKSFNMNLEFFKDIDNIRLRSNRIKPKKFVEIINKTYVVFISINKRNRRWTPYIKNKKIKMDWKIQKEIYGKVAYDSFLIDKHDKLKMKMTFERPN
jgi:hypothetical protein